MDNIKRNLQLMKLAREIFLGAISKFMYTALKFGLAKGEIVALTTDVVNSLAESTKEAFKIANLTSPDERAAILDRLLKRQSTDSIIDDLIKKHESSESGLNKTILRKNNGQKTRKDNA